MQEGTYVAVASQLFQRNRAILVIHNKTLDHCVCRLWNTSSFYTFSTLLSPGWWHSINIILVNKKPKIF